MKMLTDKSLAKICGGRHGPHLATFLHTPSGLDMRLPSEINSAATRSPIIDNKTGPPMPV